MFLEKIFYTFEKKSLHLVTEWNNKSLNDSWELLFLGNALF